MKDIRPDDGGIFARDKPKNRNDDKEKGGKPTGGLLSAFMPGDKAALARQLSFGFGGAPKGIKAFLGATYNPLPLPQFRYGGGMGGGKGNNNGGGDPNKPDVPDGYQVIDVGPDTRFPMRNNAAMYRGFGTFPAGMR